MAPRNEPSALQILLEDFRESRRESNMTQMAIRADIAALAKKFDDELEATKAIALSAHKRIDGHENRLLGWLAGIGFGSGGLGMIFGKWVS